MSHFNSYKANLKVSDLSLIKPIFQSLSTKYGLELVEKKVVTNWYNQQVFMLIGLRNNSIPPIGMTLGTNEDLLLTIDWETNHSREDNQLTKDIYTTLINQLAEYRTRKTLEETQALSRKANIVVTQKAV